MKKYWAQSIYPLQDEKGFFSSKKELYSWLSELLKISKKAFEQERKEKLPFINNKGIPLKLFKVVKLNPRKKECYGLFLKESFPFTKFKTNLEEENE